jgi:hypothetical protein
MLVKNKYSMQTYIQHLKFNIEPLIDDIKTFEVLDRTTHLAVPHNKLNPDLIALFKNYNLFPAIIEIFYTPAMGRRYIHIDEHPGGDYIKLNWQTDGKDSLMRWYTINDDSVVKTPSTTSINTRYVRFEHDEVKPAFESKIGYPSIVQVGVPHDIVNLYEPRYVLSIVPNHMKTGKRVTMSEASEIFKEYVTNIIS